MERPGWVPVVLSGIVPRGTTDALAMLTIVIVGIDYSLIPARPVFLGPGTWLQLLTIAPVSALASRSDTARKLREELALLAYGGSTGQVWLRYFVRGVACALVASLPLLYREYALAGFSIELTAVSSFLISAVGGFFYAAPSLARMRSKGFAESYKG